MDRRTFIAGGVAAGAAIAVGAYAGRRVLHSDGGNTRKYGDLVLERPSQPPDSPNVLFIVIDDSNDWMGYLNDHAGSYTPNIDALAAESLAFMNAYVHAPICMPSRSAVMFGQPGWETGVVDHSDDSRARYEKMVHVTPSLVDDFWAAGYETIGAGKIFHHVEPRRWDSYHQTEFYDSQYRGVHDADYDPRWISPYDGKPIGDGQRFDHRIIDFGPTGKAPAMEPDGISTQWLLDQLRQRARRPLFAGIGFLLPHEPWRLPGKYFALHPLEEIVVPEPLIRDLVDLPRYPREHIVDQFHTYRTLRRAHLMPRAVQAYQAAQSFVDDRIGMVLDQLASSPYADDTIVVLWSDNGYHLGEKLHVEKFTLWERATRVPFLISGPGVPVQRFRDPVGLMDLGPTLAELCGVRIHAKHAGSSLLPLVKDPSLAAARPPISIWEHGNFAVRSGPWRYIRYVTGDEELYDHRSDPREYRNLAWLSEYRPTMNELAAYLPVDRFLPEG